MMHHWLGRLGLALIGLVALVLPSMAADVTFSGDVSWRQRIALPPQSTLTVSLVTLANGQPVASARANLGDKVGSPVGFTLNVRSNVIASSGDYGLVATISHSGVTLYANAEPVPVEPTATSGVNIVVGPVPTPPGIVEPPLIEPPSGLIDTLWRVTSIGAVPVLAGSEVTLSIATDHRATGTGGCNSYFAETSFLPDAISFGPVAGTKVACATAIMDQESRFFAALGAIAGYELEGETLRLLDAAGIALIGLVRQN